MMIPPFSELKKLAKKDTPGLKKLKLALLADTASQFLTVALKGYGKQCGIDLEIYEAEYNQIEQEVFNTSSGLYTFRPEYVLVVKSSEKLIKSFYKSDKASKQSFAADQAEYINAICETIQTELKAKVIFPNFLEITDGVFGSFSNKVHSSFTYQLRKLNVLLMELGQENKSLYIADFAAIQSQYGYHFCFDPKMYVNADMVYSLDVLPLLAKSITDIMLSVTGSFKKCIVLDLDNTLWGGIIGDDGMENIQVGDLGIGKAFTEFQLWLKQMKERGIILAVCSKNTEEIAKEPFQKHPDMILSLDDIAVFVANWENKVDNIRHIQSILNIGLDSMVFFDDNPFEREMVRQAIPELTIPSLPEDPAEYLHFIRTLNLFETASFTEEDEQRAQLYREEAGRNVLKKSFTNEADFLKSLEMESEVKSFDTFNSPRVAQLTQRSNQFNLRTVRYTEEEILEISHSPLYHTLSFTLKDKYGNHGLICVVILKELDKETLFIDTWIMSCRVLKRGMERFTLDTILAVAKKEGYRKVVGEYLETKKNIIVKDHYKDLGFTPAGDNEWELDVVKSQLNDFYIKKRTEIYGLQPDAERN